ncbi:hypothetical protein MP228_008101 [Amoeboaphelidium protococcarum]|nr:hypothetical protein MP228_008101 [Amoeboaphelidium protococcarum]
MEWNISMEILQNHMDCNTASEYWSALKKDYAGKFISHKVDYVKQMSQFEFGSDIKADFIRAKTLVRGLIAANGGKKEIGIQDLMQMMLIAVLPKHLTAIRAVVNANEDLGPWEVLESRCVQEDATSGEYQSRALKVSNHPGKCFGGKCWICDPSLRPTCQKCKNAGLELFMHKEGSNFCQKAWAKANQA